ncbi:MAG TPA: G1 family glutamic endopeptidase, partial [Steroidobacteraceae bacterium]
HRFIEPTFEPRPINRPDIAKLTAEAAPLTTQSWSGAVLTGSVGDPICWVQGGWTVPSMAPPPGAPGGLSFAASPWVGIDGIGSRDILQTGCDAQVIPDNVVRYRVWYEWFPANSNYVSNMPIGAGDTFAVTIKLSPGSNASAAIIIANQSKRVAANFVVAANPGFGLVGSCAEWIVESQPQLGNLGNFGVVNFTGCRAGAVSGATVDVSSAIPVLMVDPRGRVLSAGQIVAANAVSVRFALA